VDLTPAEVDRISTAIPIGAAAGTRYPEGGMRGVYIWPVRQRGRTKTVFLWRQRKNAFQPPKAPLSTPKISSISATWDWFGGACRQWNLRP